MLQVALLLERRREAASTRLTVRRVLRATDSLLSGRAERALALAKRAESDESVGDASLAALHFARLVDRVSSDAVGTAATRYGQRFRALSVAFLSMATLAVVMGPSRIVEGLDVLVARNGVAPMPMSLLAYARISAHPP